MRLPTTGNIVVRFCSWAYLIKLILHGCAPKLSCSPTATLSYSRAYLTYLDPDPDFLFLNEKINLYAYKFLFFPIEVFIPSTVAQLNHCLVLSHIYSKRIC